jgi:tripartite-type tricarboxylate transporter receptor subunit TctC
VSTGLPERKAIHTMNTELRRRRFIAAALALGATGRVAAADAYPSRPIELVVPYGPGGASDVIARSIAEPLQQLLGQSVVVINRAGGNAAIAGAQLARSRNDGYHLLLADVALLLNAAIRTTSPGYNPDTDFQPVSLVGSGPFVLLVPANGPKTLAEFLAQGKDKGITIGSSGQGSLGHLAGELLGQKTGVKITHVPYKGSGPAMNETMAGHVDATFGSTASGMPLVASGRLRALAVASAVGLKDFPQVPTFDQLGIKGVHIQNWWGVVGPVGMEPAVVDRLGVALRQCIADPKTRERFAAMGVEPTPRPGGEFAALMKSDFARWRDVVQRAKISVE